MHARLCGPKSLLSYEHPKHMLKLMGKKICTIFYAQKLCLSKHVLTILRVVYTSSTCFKNYSKFFTIVNHLVFAASKFGGFKGLTYWFLVVVWFESLCPSLKLWSCWDGQFT